MEVFHGGGRGRVWGWYHGCGARPVKISSQARISASPAARQREEIAADRVVRGWRVQPGLSVNRGQSGGRRWTGGGWSGGGRGESRVEGSFLSWWPRVLIGGRGRLQPPCYHDYRGITRRWIVKEREREIKRGWWRTRKSPSNGGREGRWKEKEGMILARREEREQERERDVRSDSWRGKRKRRKGRGGRGRIWWTRRRQRIIRRRRRGRRGWKMPAMRTILAKSSGESSVNGLPLSAHTSTPPRLSGGYRMHAHTTIERSPWGGGWIHKQLVSRAFNLAPPIRPTRRSPLRLYPIVILISFRINSHQFWFFFSYSAGPA